LTQLNQDDIADLQSKLAFQEDELEKLHRALYQQQQRMDAMETQLKRLSEQYKDLAEQPGGESIAATEEEKPPHY
jgi:SlyX protein